MALSTETFEFPLSDLMKNITVEIVIAESKEEIDRAYKLEAIYKDLNSAHSEWLSYQRKFK